MRMHGFSVNQLCHLIVQSLPAENVEMQVMNGLTAVFAYIGEYPVSSVKLFICGDPGNRFKNVRDDSRIGVIYLIC